MAGFPARLLACPECRAAVGPDLVCQGCGARFRAEGSVPSLLPHTGASRRDVRAFYEDHPFPGYEDLDSPRALRERAARSQFARFLDEQLPLDGATLDAIGFGMADRLGDVNPGRGAIDLAFKLEENHWNGRTRAQARLVDLRPAL